MRRHGTDNAVSILCREMGVVPAIRVSVGGLKAMSFDGGFTTSQIVSQGS